MRRLTLGIVLLAAVARAGTVGVGDRAPAWTLVDWQGKAVTSADFEGRPVVVDFWASWCTVCREALPALDALARRARDDGVVVLAVNVDRRRAPADAWLAERLPAPNVTLLHDAEGALLARFGAAGMPAVYVVDRTGVVRFAESGYAPGRVDAVARAVDAIVRPESPPAVD